MPSNHKAKGHKKLARAQRREIKRLFKKQMGGAPDPQLEAAMSDPTLMQRFMALFGAAR